MLAMMGATMSDRQQESRVVSDDPIKKMSKWQGNRLICTEEKEREPSTVKYIPEPSD